MWRHYYLFALILAIIIGTSRSQKPQLGHSINVFDRYGYLGISMRVVPRDDTRTWIFREPSMEVFENSTVMTTSPPEQGRAVLNGDFHIDFCDNLKQLFQAYFRNFTLERIEKPWNAFTASWSTAVIARNFGINASFVTGNYCYALVRISRFRDKQRLASSSEGLVLNELVSRALENISYGDLSPIIQFISNYGSHYIASYTTGDSLYQVFVYSPRVYYNIKERLRRGDLNEISSYELNHYFSPWAAAHIGTIQSSSGDRSVDAWAAEKCKAYLPTLPYTNLMKLHNNADALRELNDLLSDKVLLQLELRLLAPVFKNATRRTWFFSIIDNHYKLWEENM